MTPVERAKEASSTNPTKSVTASVIKLVLLDALALFMFALGYYSRFMADDATLPALLRSPSLLDAMMFFGALCMTICGYMILNLVVKPAKYKRAM